MGNYPTPPGRRIPYDINGSVLQALADGEVTPDTADSNQMALMNNEANSEWLPSPWGLDNWGDVSILFPDKIDMEGIFVASSLGHSGDTVGACFVSVNSTNGFDGDWVQVIASLTDHYGGSDWREIDTFGYLGVIAVKFRWKRYIGELSGIHLYGKRAATGADPDHIEFLDPLNGDAIFDPLHDYEEVPRGQVQQRTFKVKNASATLTAQSVDLSIESLTGVSYDWYDFSLDDVSYNPTLALGNLTPGQTVTVYLKQGVPVTAPLGLHAARIKAEPVAWA
jgi:hypothetical protein